MDRTTTSLKELSTQSPQSARAIPYLHTLATTGGRKNKGWLLQLDGDLYFPETFAPRRLEKSYGLTGEKGAQKVSQGRSALAILFKATDAEEIPRPTPYYSILAMDGDNIGLLLNDVKNEEQHKKVSGALSNFARDDALYLVEQQYPGRLVYSGGDDVSGNGSSGTKYPGQAGAAE